MKCSSGIPMSVDVPVVTVVERYIALLQTLTYENIPKDLIQLYKHQLGFAYRSPVAFELTSNELRNYYHQRLKGNVKAFASTLANYISARLEMLNDIPLPRDSIALNTYKSPRPYYNLSRASAREIQEVTFRNPSLNDFKRLQARISLEAIYTFGNIGRVDPNPRCDDSVKLLLSYINKFIDLAVDDGRVIENYTKVLTLLTDITRLYYGAVGCNDRDTYETSSSANLIERNYGSRAIRISNSMVACLPYPNLNMVSNFHDDTAAVISKEATNYVTTLENATMQRM